MMHTQIHNITVPIILVSAITSLICMVGIFGFFLENRDLAYEKGYKAAISQCNKVNEQNLLLTKKAGLCVYAELVCKK